jgi:hypothetical protein
VWPYLLDADDMDVGMAPDDIETLRAEFAAVVKERRRRAATDVHLIEVGVDECGRRAAKRRRANVL